jgi:Ca2+-binding RTX toxin-like protein
MAITAAVRQDIMELAVLMNNKAPGTTLLSELVAKSAAGSSLTEIAEHLAGRAEFTAAYPTFQTANEFATEWLATALPEASASLLAECVTIVEAHINGGGSIPALVVSVQAFMTDAANADGGLKTHIDNFANKVTVATYHTITKEAAAEWEIPATVTSDATTVATANAAADTALAPVPVAAKTIALTTGLDTGAAFTGAATDDIFVGVNNDAATTGTLTAGDNLAGGEGTDTLKVVASGTATPPLVSTSSIEVVELTNNSGAGYSLNTSLMTGLAKVQVTGGANTSTLTNSQGNLNIGATSTNFDIVTSSAVPSVGSADAISIDLQSVGTTTNTSITSDGIETFNVGLLGAASGSTVAGAERVVTVASNQLETVNITGSVGANLAASLAGASAFGQVGTVDASKATGNLTINVTPGGSTDGKTSIALGSGDDELTIGALDKDQTITGGEGTDTLVATASAPGATLAAANYVGVGVSGFEQASAAGGGSIDFRSLANNTTFVSTDGAGTYSKAPSAIANSYIDAASGTVTLTRATDGAADALNFHITDATAATVAATLVDEETITVASAGTGSGLTHNLTLTVTDATKLSVIGTNGLNITSLVGETKLATIDASGNTGQAFTVNASGSTAAMTVTGSAGTQASLGATVNNITTGTGADKVTGGDYADTLTTGTGNDSVTGGGGNDTLTTAGGNDTVIAGAGDDTVTAGTGSDSISGGDGNDQLDAGSGADTVDGGAGTDRIVVALSDSTSVDGGAGTDRVSASTATVTSTTAASVTGQFIAVADSAKPTLTGVEQLHVRVDADASGTALANQVNLDLTNASSLTTLHMDTDDNTQNSFMKVTNFAGTSATLYGGTSFGSGAEAENIAFDGVGQAASTLNLQGFLQTADGTLTVTGIQGMTIAADSTSQLTGSADQDNSLGVVTANSATALTITSSGSSTTNAAALTVASVSATGVNDITLTGGAFDDVTISADITGGTAVETANVTVGTDGELTMAQLDMSTSNVLTTNITVNAGGHMSNEANTTIITAEAVDVIAASIADLNIDLQPGAQASLLLNGTMTDADVSLGASSLLVLEDSLGSAGSASNFKFTGRGDLDADVVGTGLTTTANSFVLAGTTVVFDSSGLTTDADTMTMTTTATVGANIKTGLGADTITGAAGNDTISGGAGGDTVTGMGGADSITLGTGTDVVIVNNVAGTSSNSDRVATAGNDNDTGQDTITGITWGTDTIRVVTTGATNFEIADDVFIGTATGGVDDGTVGSFVATTGSLDFQGTGAVGTGDISINFSSPSATMTNALLQAALVFNIGGSAGADVITTGAGADTISGGGGVDSINGGAASDIIVLGDSTDGNNYDQITGYTTTADDIQALQSVHGWNSTANTTTVALQTGASVKAADANGDGNILTLSGNVATHTYATFMAGTSNYAQLETAAATAMGDTGALDSAAIVLVAIDDTAHTGLWQFTSGDNTTDDATATTEIELIGILVGVTDATALVVGDFVFT